MAGNLNDERREISARVHVAADKIFHFPISALRKKKNKEKEEKKKKKKQPPPKIVYFHCLQQCK